MEILIPTINVTVVIVGDKGGSAELSGVIDSETGEVKLNTGITFDAIPEKGYGLVSYKVSDITSIAYAILESNGTLSVIKKDDSLLKSPFPLINDGEIDEYIMKK